MKNRLGIIVTSLGVAMFLLCGFGSALAGENAESGPVDSIGVKGTLAFAVAAAERITGGKAFSAMPYGDNCRVIVFTVDHSIEILQVNVQTGEVTGRRRLVWNDEPMNEDSEGD